MADERLVAGGVYPRPRGGTAHALSRARRLWGLSPPTRGNRRQSARLSRRYRSIPAHAGEPASAYAKMVSREVYPRPRGGTLEGRAANVRSAGLSPPTRGNHAPPRRHVGQRRSIPAHAGEPRMMMSSAAISRVYPRPRGGTTDTKRRSRKRCGLSPPTRGNPAPAVRAVVQDRSIPAHAGEPRDSASATISGAVYPRPRGGTAGARF